MILDSGLCHDLSFLIRRFRVRIRASAFGGGEIAVSALEDSVCPASAMPDVWSLRRVSLSLTGGGL